MLPRRHPCPGTEAATFPSQQYVRLRAWKARRGTIWKQALPPTRWGPCGGRWVPLRGWSIPAAPPRSSASIPSQHLHRRVFVLLPMRLGLPACAYGGKTSPQLYINIRMATRVPGTGTHCPVSAALPDAHPTVGTCARLGDSGMGLPACNAGYHCMPGGLFFAPSSFVTPPRRGASLVVRVPV